MLNRNRAFIDGLLMDATWKIIRNAVTSILMVSIFNVGIPVALAVGPREDKALYEIFHKIFAEEFGITLNGLRVVSDRGSALQAICTSHDNDQFFCLRHFLVSLKLRMWSEEIGNLIRCRVVGDYGRLCAEYEPRFAEAITDPNSPQGKHLLKMLRMVGLGMTNGRIGVDDQVKWDAISMIKRVEVNLPSTSNALESFHGHANEQTPRRNDFLPSIVRASTMMIRKTLSFRASLEANFAIVVRKAHRRAKNTDPEILSREREQYETTIADCGCGETRHYSAMYRIHCPCSHQYSIGASKPQAPNVQLDLGNPAPVLDFRIETLARERAPPCIDIGKLQARAVKDIKRFSHSRKTKEIEGYVRERFRLGTEFALGRPVSLFGLVSDGIIHFSSS
jgi:hypothetical protein